MIKETVELLKDIDDLASSENVKKLPTAIKAHKRLTAGIIVAVAVTAAVIWGIAKQLSIIVTQVVLNETPLSMTVGESKTVSATVLYSNNTTGSKVLWVSGNESVVTVDQNGRLTAVGKGTATITAQASRNNTTQTAECVVTVNQPPSGYAISASTTTAPLGAYINIYVKPYDADVTQIQIYAQSPSGQLFTPELDVNDLYHFYSERGTWTVYAALQNEGGTYEANLPEDFLTIEIT